MLIALGLLAVVIGGVFLATAGDALVAGSVRVAEALGVGSFIVGVVVVGFGTSAPELVASSVAAVGGDHDIASGNVLGSNTANLSLVLGATCWVRSVRIAAVQRQVEFPLVAATTVLYLIVAGFGYPLVGGLVLLGLTAPVLWVSRQRAAPATPPESESDGLKLREVSLLVLGLAGLIAGAQIMIVGARTIADELDLSGGLVGFLIVALGTSLPELAAALAAARRNQAEVVIGGLLGSNLFNSLVVGGTIVVIGRGESVPESLLVTGGISALSATALAWMLGGRGELGSRSGSALLMLYLASLIAVGAG